MVLMNQSHRCFTPRQINRLQQPPSVLFLLLFLFGYLPLLAEQHPVGGRV